MFVDKLVSFSVFVLHKQFCISNYNQPSSKMGIYHTVNQKLYNVTCKRVQKMWLNKPHLVVSTKGVKFDQ